MGLFSKLKSVVSPEARQAARRKKAAGKNPSVRDYIHDKDLEQYAKKLGVSVVEVEKLRLVSQQQRSKLRDKQISKYDAKGLETPHKKDLLPSSALLFQTLEAFEQTKALNDMKKIEDSLKSPEIAEMSMEADVPAQHAEPAQKDFEPNDIELPKPDARQAQISTENAVDSELERNGLNLSTSMGKRTGEEEGGTHKVDTNVKEQSQQVKLVTPQQKAQKAPAKKPKKSVQTKVRANLFKGLSQKQKKLLARSATVARSSQAKQLSKKLNTRVQKSSMNTKAMQNILASKQSRGMQKAIFAAQNNNTPAKGKKIGRLSKAIAKQQNRNLKAIGLKVEVNHEFVKNTNANTNTQSGKVTDLKMDKNPKSYRLIDYRGRYINVAAKNQASAIEAPPAPSVNIVSEIYNAKSSRISSI